MDLTSFCQLNSDGNRFDQIQTETYIWHWWQCHFILVEFSQSNYKHIFFLLYLYRCLLVIKFFPWENQYIRKYLLSKRHCLEKSTSCFISSQQELIVRWKFSNIFFFTKIKFANWSRESVELLLSPVEKLKMHELISCDYGA